MNQESLREAVVRAFEVLGVDRQAGIARLAALYHERVRFRDPLTTLEGRERLIAAMRRHHGGMRSLRTEVLASSVTERDLFVAWRFAVELRLGPTLTFDGVSRFRLEGGQIVEQRDYFDLLGSLMDSAPLVAPLYRRLVGLFA